MARPNGEVLGLAHQAVWAREDKARKKRRLAKARSKRGRSKQQQLRPKPPRARTEAAVWEETVVVIGPCPEGKRWISIGDRGADITGWVSPEACKNVIRHVGYVQSG